MQPPRSRSHPSTTHFDHHPVKDGLVDRAHLLARVNGLRAPLAGHPITATRPWHFFRRDGSSLSHTCNYDASTLATLLRQVVDAPHDSHARMSMFIGAPSLASRAHMDQLSMPNSSHISWNHLEPAVGSFAG